MKRRQNSLFAGVAALALIAGTGLASAQTAGGTNSSGMQRNQQHGTQHGTQSGTQSTGGAGLRAQGQGGTNRSAQNARSGIQGNQRGSGTQPQVQGNSGAAAQNATQRNNRQVERNNRSGRSNRAPMGTAQRERTLRGLQGNASGPMQGQSTSRQGQQTGQSNTPGRQTLGTARESGTNVQLTPRQRTQIRRTVINARNAPRVGRVGFNVRVGTVIPRGRLRIVPVPQTLVRIEPRWRGYLYFVYADQIVIVNPLNMRIVAILPA